MAGSVVLALVEKERDEVSLLLKMIATAVLVSVASPWKTGLHR